MHEQWQLPGHMPLCRVLLCQLGTGISTLTRLTFARQSYLPEMLVNMYMAEAATCKLTADSDIQQTVLSVQHLQM